MKGMTTMMMALILATASFMSPMKMAFLVTMVSIQLSVLFFNLTQNTFISSALVISFSSGMMILFCFCSMMSGFEKSNIKPSMALMSTMVLVSTLTELIYSEFKETTSQSVVSATPKTTFLMVLMGVVLLVMCSINLSMFNPSKKIKEMY